MTASTAPVAPPVVTSDSPRTAGGSRRRLRALLVPVAASVMAGLLLFAALPPSTMWPLAPVAVALLTGALLRRSVRFGALLGLLAGLAYFVPMLRWTAPVAGVDAWLILAVSQGVQWAALGAGGALLTRLRAWPLLVPGLWVASEAARGRVPFGGFPWGRLAMTQADGPLAAWAALGGVPLVTAAVAAVGVALVVALGGRGAPRVRAVGVVGAAAVLTGGVLLTSALPSTGDSGAATVAVVQGGVPGRTLETLARERVVLDNHVTLTAELADAVSAGRKPAPDLVVWPENASDIDPYSVPQARQAIERAAADVGVPVLAGVIERLPDDERANVSVVVDPRAGLGERYVKRAPVPFAEYMPFRPLVSSIFTRVEDLLPTDMVAGRAPGLLHVGGIDLGALICFEVVFDDLVRDVAGSELVVLQTNNATFGEMGEAEQQIAMARLRAVEHGRTVVVSSTSGVSAVIDPEGSVLASTGTYSRELLVETVSLRDGSTFAAQLGALPEMALALSALAGVAAAGVRSRGAA